MINTNPEMGIRYGIIAANSLDPDWVWDMQQGRDVHYEEAHDALVEGIKRACGDLMSDAGIQEVIALAEEHMSDHWEDGEPVHEFELQGVKGRTTWLGGALLVWVYESPHITQAKLCSPCLPNCGDLDNLALDEFDCYDVPTEWRLK